MNNRDSTTCLMLNTDAIDVSEESSTDDDSDDGSASNEGDVSSNEEVTTKPTGINSDAVVPRESEGSPSLVAAANPNQTDGKNSGNNRTRRKSTPRSIGSVSSKSKDTADELSSSYPMAELENKTTTCSRKRFQWQTLKLKRQKVDASAIETQARIAESTARKHHFEAQTENCELQRKVALLRERHKLRQE
ncbi:hypothetical protein PPTG_19517, partial [Phytophthora nicotianae INRA-310]